MRVEAEDDEETEGDALISRIELEAEGEGEKEIDIDALGIGNGKAGFECPVNLI